MHVLAAQAEVAAKAFVAAGADILMPSCGFATRTGLLMLRGTAPVRQMVAAAKHFHLRLAYVTRGLHREQRDLTIERCVCRVWCRLRLFHRVVLRHNPFGEGFLRPAARRILAAISPHHHHSSGDCDDAATARQHPVESGSVQSPSQARVALLGGVNRLDTMARAMAEGFSFVAMARALLREPRLVRKLRRSAEAMAGGSLGPVTKTPVALGGEAASAAAAVTAAAAAPAQQAASLRTNGCDGPGLRWLGQRSVDSLADAEAATSQHAPLPCDHCNLCIVGATMAETPLACVRRGPRDVDYNW